MSTRLSHDLQSLAAWFDAVREGTAEFTFEGARAFAHALHAAADRAAAIEHGDGDPVMRAQFGDLLVFSPTGPIAEVPAGRLTVVVDNTRPAEGSRS